MRVGILLFMFVILISSVSAQNITVDYPSEVSVGEEFSFVIELLNFSEDNYDIKIDVLVDGERIARILNDGQWKSTYYYVNDIISPNEDETFSLNVTEYIGSADITIKIRDSSGGIETFDGYEIEVVETEEPVEEAEEDEETTKEENVVEEFQEIKEPVSRETGPVELPGINLNPQVIKSENDNENLSKSNYAVYGLVFFCVLLVALFILRKNKHNKNEFR